MLLLISDAALRQAAESEQIDVKGTLWLIEVMMKEGKITLQVARAALRRMQVNGRKLPWAIAEQRLSALEQD